MLTRTYMVRINMRTQTAKPFCTGPRAPAVTPRVTVARRPFLARLGPPHHWSQVPQGAEPSLSCEARSEHNQWQMITPTPVAVAEHNCPRLL